MEPFGGRVGAGRSGPPQVRSGVPLRARAPQDRGAAGQRSRTPADEFLRALEEASGRIRHPAAKLRFIRESLQRYQSVDRCVRAVPLAPMRRLLYRWLGLEGLRHLLTTTPLGTAVALDRRARVNLLLMRAATVAGTMVVLGVLGGIGVSVYRLWQSGSSPVEAAPRVAETQAALLPAAAPAASVPPKAGLAPAGIWLVERGKDFEQYSNGLRIDTSATVRGEPRSFQTFDRQGRLEPTVHHTPVGILFHTSESDIWPLEAGYNENLRTSSHRLLRYVARNKLYHYLVDRFGRVYRVVDEQAKANHAGHSVWMRGEHVYLNLNHAFIGVSFESRWEGGRVLPITQAQFAAGRVLADYLRQHWEIPPEMCVAHGLTSVNPKKHLIGHHLDWARGFPFEAFGLPDQYLEPAPSVVLFGFGYDEEFLKVMGEPWAGVRAAERELAARAQQAGLPVEVYRRERQDLYEQWFAIQARGEEAMASTQTGQSPTSQRSGG